jgi:hypothetical protein
LNPVPINCLQHFSMNHNSGTPSLNKLGDGSNACLYKTVSSIRALPNVNNENTGFDDSMLLMSEEDLFRAPVNSFNQLENGSCLKQLNQRLKMKQDLALELSRNREQMNKNKKILHKQQRFECFENVRANGSHELKVNELFDFT